MQVRKRIAAERSGLESINESHENENEFNHIIISSVLLLFLLLVFLHFICFFAVLRVDHDLKNGLKNHKSNINEENNTEFTSTLAHDGIGA